MDATHQDLLDQLKQAQDALAAEGARQVGGSSRRKSFSTRVDAQVKRLGKLRNDIQRLERELDELRNPGNRKAAAGHYTPSALAEVRHVRTAVGWHEVVKVNRATVKVKTRPGMDDLIKLGQIIEARTASGVVLPAA